jgi:hypothetical protein
MNKSATEEDVKAGRAIFYVPDERSLPYDLGRPLPLPGKFKVDTQVSPGDLIPAETIVQIVQCEIVDDEQILVGFYYAAGQGICELSEVTLIDDATG